MWSRPSKSCRMMAKHSGVHNHRTTSLKTLTFLITAVALVSVRDTGAGVPSGLLKPVITILVGAGAAESLAKGFDANARGDQKQSIKTELEQQGIDPTDGAIYSLHLNLDYHSHAIYWARWFTKPDLFAVIQFEGQNPYVIPDIERKFHGEPIQWTVLQKHAAKGQRIVIQILDDHTASNEIWNSILQSKVTFHHGDITFDKSLSASWDGEIQVALLDKKVTIAPPTHIAYAEFRAPPTNDKWHAEGIFRDDSGQEIGKLEFAQVWTGDPRLSNEILREGSSKIFWVVFGILLLFVFFRLLFSNWFARKSADEV
jgi:hypothetical protein